MGTLIDLGIALVGIVVGFVLARNTNWFANTPLLKPLAETNAAWKVDKGA